MTFTVTQSRGCDGESRANSGAGVSKLPVFFFTDTLRKHSKSLTDDDFFYNHFPCSDSSSFFFFEFGILSTGVAPTPPFGGQKGPQPVTNKLEDLYIRSRSNLAACAPCLSDTCCCGFSSCRANTHSSERSPTPD